MKFFFLFLVTVALLDCKMKSEENWSIFSGTDNGKKIIIRYNKGLGEKYEYGDPKHPFRAGIAIPFQNPDSTGLPSPDENQVFSNIEDSIFEKVQDQKRGVIAAIITTNGMREFMMYIKTANELNAPLAELQKKYPSYKFTNYVTEDLGWTDYRLS